MDNGGESMKKSFKQFMSEQMDKFNTYDEETLKNMRKHFEKVLEMILEKLGKDAFAKYKVENQQLKLQSHFNAAVYDAIAIAVSEQLKSNPNFEITDVMKNRIENLFYDKGFIDFINGSTNDKSKILGRIEMVKGVLS